jgi:hypothetical protein
MILADLPLRWVLRVDRNGHPILWHPEWGKRAIACVADQPRTVLRLVRSLDKWVAVAEQRYPVDDQALIAARFALVQLRQYAAEHLGVKEVA